jgi:hypothetical protein
MMANHRRTNNVITVVNTGTSLENVAKKRDQRGVLVAAAQDGRTIMMRTSDPRQDFSVSMENRQESNQIQKDEVREQKRGKER